MDFREAHLRNECEAFLEKRVGLSRETHDDVSSNRNIRHGFTHVFQQPRESFRVIMAVHCVQNRVGAGLERQVQMLCETRLIAQQREKVVRQLDGFQRAEPQACEAGKRQDFP